MEASGWQVVNLPFCTSPSLRSILQRAQVYLGMGGLGRCSMLCLVAIGHTSGRQCRLLSVAGGCESYGVATFLLSRSAALMSTRCTR
jgi:hypothetical protein